MAVQEKLIKSLEILKKLSYSNTALDLTTRKKDIIQHSQIVVDCISNAVTTVSTGFPMILSNTMELFFILCDDSDSNIRMVAEECLNKIIRVLNNENVTKVLIELHKEIKRNNSARCVRAALTRFSKLAHCIRPHKGKPYVLNLCPSLIKVISRPEEMIHEAVSTSLTNIIEVLGPFTTDNDIKNLLKSLMANVSNPSAVIKRTAAISIQNICLNCPQPYLSTVYCIHMILGFVFPLNENCDTHLILGTLGVLKILLPHWKKLFKEISIKQSKGTVGSEWEELEIDKQLKIYELSIHYVNHKDHNLVNSSLETLNILLQNCTKEFVSVLLNRDGLNRNKANSIISFKKRSSSQLSIATNSTLFDNPTSSEAELTDSIRPDVAKWIDQSKLAVLDAPFDKSVDTLEKSFSVDSSNATLTRSFSSLDLESGVDFESIKNCDVRRSRDHLEISTNSSEKSFSCNDVTESLTKDVYIGEFDEPGPSLIYCARLLAKLFLLSGIPGNLISDKVCRISVKSSALSCMSSILRLCPNILFQYLDKSVSVPDETMDQSLSDILLYSNHYDPQLRGSTRMLIANYLISAFIESRGNYDVYWNMKVLKNCARLQFDYLMAIIKSGLEDSSSICVRCTLQCLELCLFPILESEKHKDALPILLKLPSLARNPYWLIKVNLCELISNLNYTTIHYSMNGNTFQTKVLHYIIYELLEDADVRVRNATSNALIRLIPKLYFDEHLSECPITSKAISYRNTYLSNLFDKSWIDRGSSKDIAETLSFPYNSISNTPKENIEFALSKVISDLSKIVLFSKNEQTVPGCIETLSALSHNYPCTHYRKAWTCDLGNENDRWECTNDLLKLSIDFMNNSSMVYDIGFHTNLLTLSSNLYAGFSVSNLIPMPQEELSSKWNMFKSSEHSKLSDIFLKHIVKILSIYQHIVDDINLPNLHSKPLILSIPTGSPIKKKKSEQEKKIINPIKLMEEKGDKKEKSLIGAFSHIPHYVKIYDSLKTAYGNYKTSLEPEASEKFLKMLKQSLKSLSILMEIGGLPEFGGYAEEILNYLNTTFKIVPSASVKCVQQLLKSIFGTNLVSYGVDNIQQLHKTTKEEHQNIPGISTFYYQFFLISYDKVSRYVSSLKDLHKIECDGDNTVMGYLHRNTKRRIINTANFDKVLANYIRIFEPMVIKSLKQYTITSDVKLQGRVLQLLSQLVQLKINYCLLDADQIFINFVLNQFEYIEAGQIKHSEELIPNIFQFLLQLSYSKQHSKSIIGIPKIIQLCDGLSASGQCPLTHCIPAFRPIVEDIFFDRNALNTPDTKELETTREVVLAMLLKLMEYHEVIDLITFILEDSKYCSDEDKWLRWSQNVVNSFLPIFKENKYKLDNINSLNSLRDLIFSLNPNVFRPIDDIMVMLFQEPPTLVQDLTCYTRWMGKILVILMILSPLEEDVILSKISSLKNNFVPNSIFENVIVTSDPLNVTNCEEFFQHLSPEVILIRFIFRTLTLATKKCTLIVDSNEDLFFVEELSLFMMLCLHNFQSGFLSKTSNIAISIIEKSKYAEECDAICIQTINENFQNLIYFFPTLTSQWCYFLILLGYDDRNFWSSILQLPRDDNTSCKHVSNSINTELVKVGGSIVFCDYLCENSEKKVDDVIWQLRYNINLLINLEQEAPVHEFISFIHKDAAYSQCLLSSIEQQDLNNKNVVFNMKVLKFVENIHPNLTGQLIKFLLSKMIFLREPAVIREVSKLATRKLELLLTMPLDSIHYQLSEEDLIAIITSLYKNNLNIKQEALLGLLHKLGLRFYNINLQNVPNEIVDTNFIRNLDAGQSWYLSQLKSKINNAKIGREVAQMMSNLNYDVQMEIMLNINFERVILKDCMDYGINNMSKEVPDILRASVDYLSLEIGKILTMHSKIFQIKINYDSDIDNLPSIVASNSGHSHKLDTAEFSNVLYSIMPCVLCYLEYIPYISSINISQETSKNITKFCLLSLEYVDSTTNVDKYLNVSLTEYTLRCVDLLLKESIFFNLLNTSEYTSLSCSAVVNVYKILKILLEELEPLEKLSADVLKELEAQFENSSIAKACSALYSLFYWLYRKKTVTSDISSVLMTTIKSIIVSLARLSLFNSHMIIPIKIWDKGFCFTPSSSPNSVIQLPVEVLQSTDILEEYIFRITTLGWNSRQQFEETWMCLLSVLCHTPHDTSTPEEVNEIYTCISLVVKGITSMLIQTLYYPVPGKKNVSKLLNISRDAPIMCNTVSLKKLRNIYHVVQHKYESLSFSEKIVNVSDLYNDSYIERRQNRYSSSQMSVKYFLIAIGIVQDMSEKDPVYDVWKSREETLQQNGLDITSCLHFFLDFYTQMLQLQKVNSLAFLQEAVISILALSDLFNDRSQFNWMLDLFLSLLKTHSLEDELIHQYLIIGICKSAAVLNPELEIYEIIKKYLVQNLRSSFLPSKIACLHGLLYILEGCILSNISIGNISEELQIILPCAIEYILSVLNTTNRSLHHSQEYMLLIWNLAFYIVEHIPEAHFEHGFIENVLTKAYSVLYEAKRNIEEYKAVTRRLQRLIVLRKHFLENFGSRIVKCAFDGLKNVNQLVAVSSMQLLLTYMYTEYAEQVESNQMHSNTENPEQTIEKFSAIFEYIKRSYIFEVEVVCSLLPQLLDDFFNPAEILTKVICEFLTAQQPHQRVLSNVVFHLFQSAIRQDQLTLLQDWIVFSLPNFTQNFSYPMATWCLTCFFISASCNKWLTSFFPYIQTRIQRYEYEDREMLCVAGSDFYKNLSNDKQKHTFKEHFKIVRDLPEMPFNDLLSSL